MASDSEIEKEGVAEGGKKVCLLRRETDGGAVNMWKLGTKLGLIASASEDRAVEDISKSMGRDGGMTRGQGDSGIDY